MLRVTNSICNACSQQHTQITHLKPHTESNTSRVTLTKITQSQPHKESQTLKHAGGPRQQSALVKRKAKDSKNEKYDIIYRHTAVRRATSTGKQQYGGYETQAYSIQKGMRHRHTTVQRV